MIVKVDDLVQSPPLSTSSTPVDSPDKEGVPSGAVCRQDSMDDARSVGSSHGRSSHSSHSHHSHRSSSGRRLRSHSKAEHAHGSGSGARDDDDDPHRKRERRRRSEDYRHHQHQHQQQQHPHEYRTQRERYPQQQQPPSELGGPLGPKGRVQEKEGSTCKLDKGEIAKMYLDTKQNMFEIIEEGLHMKLELKNIKQQFLSLLENYEAYEQRPALLPSMRASSGVPLTEKAIPSPRARVRALYDARRARIQARRTMSSASAPLSAASETPRRSLRRSSFPHNNNNDDKENDKENACARKHRQCKQHENIISSEEKYGGKVTTSTPFCKPHKHCACHPRTAPSQLLTPIAEEGRRRVRRRDPTSAGSSSGAASPTLSELEGEYVMLRSPSQEGIVSMEVDSYTDGPSPAPAPPPQPLYQSRQSESKLAADQTSIWINTNDNLGLYCPQLLQDESSNKENIAASPAEAGGKRRESPVKYASSDVISELYTSKSLSNLKDVSQISRISVGSLTLREQSSGSNISGNLHSTFNYPLHSTLNYPLSSTMNMSPAECSHRYPNHLEEPDFKCLSDARTTISEPSAVLRRRRMSKPKERSPRSLDDSIVDIRSLQRSDARPGTAMSSDSARSRRNKSRTARTRRRERLKARERDAQLTPLTHREPQLCKEHGLHPTFGGPCIFQTDDSFTLSETTTEEDEEEARPRSSTAVTETDNDSSYLSECVEDSSSHFGQSNCRAEDYTATYDARQGRMRMLKRQTGQTVLDKTTLRPPIGLSESDFFDVTRKHLSLEATRSSLPDLSALSTTTTSEADDGEGEASEDTLHASQVNTSMKDSDGFWSPNSLDDTIVSVESRHTGVGVGVSRRPLSISTSTTTSTTDNTSPESAESRDMPVPVNSPNVTDSGSSRPTTDTYDYVDVPKFTVMGPPVSLPPRYQPPPRRRNPGVRPPCTVGKQAASPTATTTAAAAAAASMQQLEDDFRFETRSEGRGAGGARKCLRYHHDYDSGFSTPGSGRRAESGRHIQLSDNAGHTRTVVQHSAVARNLQHDRKKQLVKKLKQFSSNFYKSTGNLHIHTLGHF